jgi:Spy/CpxP family protein refolding chaperone
MSDAPKSAYELAMERLRKKDADEGVQQTTLTDAQRAAIAEIRSSYEARVAERKIMHQSTVASLFDPAELEARALELRRDLERFERERDEKIARVRKDERQL